MKSILILLALGIAFFGCLGEKVVPDNGTINNPYPGDNVSYPPTNNNTYPPTMNNTNTSNPQYPSTNTTIPSTNSTIPMNGTMNNTPTVPINSTYNSSSDLSCGKICHITSANQQQLCVSQSDPQQICTMQYSIFDQCKPYYDCMTDGNSCVAQKTTKYDSCVSCISQCDIADSSACVQSCYNQINGIGTNNTVTNGNDTSSNNGSTPVNPNNTTMAGITSAQLFTHNSRNNCWVTNDAKVYDITSWISENQVLADNIYLMCGTNQSFNSTFENFPEINKDELFVQENLKGDYKG